MFLVFVQFDIISIDCTMSILPNRNGSIFCRILCWKTKQRHFSVYSYTKSMSDLFFCVMIAKLNIGTSGYTEIEFLPFKLFQLSLTTLMAISQRLYNYVIQLQKQLCQLT